LHTSSKHKEFVFKTAIRKFTGEPHSSLTGRILFASTILTYSKDRTT